MKRLVIQLMQAKQTNGAFKFSSFLKLDPFRKKQAHRGPSRTLWDDDCGFLGPPVDPHPNREDGDHSERTGTEAVINSVIFIAVWLFMICNLRLSSLAICVLTRHESSPHLG